jgi:hypothetical protein
MQLTEFLIMTKTEQLFANVLDTLHTRGTAYGHPIENHKRIANLWSAYLGFPIQPNEVAICMSLVKISRQAEDARIVDNYTDAIGYMAIANTITEAMQDVEGVWKDGV